MMEISTTLVQMFAVFAIVLLASGIMKSQKRNDDQLCQIPVRVRRQRQIRR